jgi:L-lactate dehydrogenase complex protein LldF
MQRRDAEAAAVPEWEELRELGSHIKEHALTHLDEYLTQFEANATQRGAQVHWARDAAEHNEIVYAILQGRGVTELIKSKSMLQEECVMTPFLERRGITVTESDLGERIQQLDGQPPSHIVFPAIHKTRQEVAQLFARTSGIPCAAESGRADGRSRAALCAVQPDSESLGTRTRHSPIGETDLSRVVPRASEQPWKPEH